jgi:hypothetical protein
MSDLGQVLFMTPACDLECPVPAISQQLHKKKKKHLLCFLIQEFIQRRPLSIYVKKQKVHTKIYAE